MRTHTTISLSIPLLLLAAGCAQNPFLPHDNDYARRVAMERLRALPPANLDQYRSTIPVDTSKLDTVLDSVRQARERFDAMEKMDLGLEQCRKATIENNLDLKAALIDPTIAAERVREEDAKFNAAFTLQTSYADAEFPTASRLSSSAFKQFQVNPGVRIPTRTGGNVVVDFVGNRSETNNEFSLLNPSYESDLRFTLSHALMRNAGRRVNTAGIVIAGYNEQASQARTKLEAMQQVTNADRAYWRLYQSRASLDVRLQQFEVAMSQIERADRRVRDGAAADIEVDRAKAGAAQRLESIVLAQNDVLLRQRELKRVMNQPGLDIDTKVMVIPASPPDPVQYVFDVTTLQQLALASRMELLELQLQLASDAVNIGVERNRMLPLVDLQFSYRLNGLGDNFGKALETTAEHEYPDWTLSLNAEVPLDNEEARSRVRRSLLTRMQRIATKEAREQTIRTEVLNAADSLELGWQRILAARQAVISATRALQSEQRQFDLGRSTSNDVLNAASNLGDAQIAEVQALTDYQQAQIDLAFATGTLLGAAKVEIEPAAAIDLKDHPQSKDPVPLEDVK
ncbi:MAG: TolC family protein [Phycisphaerales bacterium]